VWGVAPVATGSDTEEGLCEPRQEAGELQRRVGRGQADAVLARFGDGGVHVRFGCHLDIAGAESVMLIMEGALENLCEFEPAMAVIGHRRAGRE
jgi:hypothetical protein